MTPVPERLQQPLPTQHPGVIAKEHSTNRKIGAASATYVAQQSCPTTCSFYNAGCYAESGFVGFQTRKLNRQADAWDTSPLALATIEADAIDTLTGRRDLRLHVVGDSTTKQGTQFLARAARRFIAKFNRSVWSYTHAWRTVPRSAWGAVSILASCETVHEIRRARMKGYATAVVVDEFKDTKLYEIDGEKILPCPEMTRSITCTDCRLCMRDDYLRESGITIAFAAHGQRANLVKEKTQHG